MRVLRGTGGNRSTYFTPKTLKTSSTLLTVKSGKGIPRRTQDKNTPYKMFILVSGRRVESHGSVVDFVVSVHYCTIENRTDFVTVKHDN